MKFTFRLTGIIAAALFVIAAASSAREWFILYHVDGYQPLDLVIGHARREVSGETECILAGRVGTEAVEFHISTARYEQFSANEAVGTTLRIWKNDMMPDISDITFQQESLKVFLDEDWRPRDELRHRAVSTSVIAGILLASAIPLFLLGRTRYQNSVSSTELDSP